MAKTLEIRGWVKTMKILSHIQKLRPQENSLTGVRNSKKAYYRGFDRDGYGNTRLKPIACVESHLDYLRVAGEVESPDEFALLACFISKDYALEFDTPWSPGSAANYYPNRILGSRGIRGGFNIEEEGTVRYMVDLSGEYFEGMSVVDSWRLLKGLTERFRARGTRIDIAIDDPEYQAIPVKKMVSACQEGYNFGFKKIGYHSSGFCGERQSETFTFGSRESGKFVRVYDHDEECLRFEVEFKRGYANPIFQELGKLERPDGMPDRKWEILLQKQLSSIAVGAIDFRDRGRRKDKGKAGYRDSERLEFYQEFIDFLGASHYRIKLEKPAKTIRKSIDWFVNQCAPTLSMIQLGVGWKNFHPWLREVLKRASLSLDNQKNLWIKEIQKNPKSYLSSRVYNLL